MRPDRLYRSRTDRMVAGVAGGLAHYFNLDPTIVRLFFVLGAIFGHLLAALVYVALWLLVPEEPLSVDDSTAYRSAESSFSAAAAGGSAAEGGAAADPFGPAADPAGGANRPTGETGPFFGHGRFGRTGSFGRPDPYGPFSFGDEHHRRGAGFGWALVVIGALVLAQNLHLLSWISFDLVWPLFLIGAGVLLLYRHGYIH